MMNAYYKNIALLAILFITGCEDPKINSVNYSSFGKLEFQVTGGFAGIQYQTTISENGEAAFIYYYKNHKYIITKMLSREQLDSLNTILIENKIFDLKDEYKPAYPVTDGFNYKINYYSYSEGNKNIIVEDGIEIPDELKIIIRKLSEINSFVQSNADYGTLVSVWDQMEVIKKWMFPEIILEQKAYYYSELNNSGRILSYFEEIKKNIGYNILYLDGGSLYSIYDGGTDYGYFNAYEVFPAKLWYNFFQADISIVQSTGIFQSVDEWDKMDISFKKTYVYVIDKIEDNGKAIKVSLIPGKPYNN